MNSYRRVNDVEDYEVNKPIGEVIVVNQELVELTVGLDDDDDDEVNDDLFEIWEYLWVLVNNSVHFRRMNDRRNVNLDYFCHEKISNKRINNYVLYFLLLMNSHT